MLEQLLSKNNSTSDAAGALAWSQSKNKLNATDEMSSFASLFQGLSGQLATENFKLENAEQVASQWISWLQVADLNADFTSEQMAGFQPAVPAELSLLAEELAQNFELVDENLELTSEQNTDLQSEELLATAGLQSEAATDQQFEIGRELNTEIQGSAQNLTQQVVADEADEAGQQVAENLAAATAESSENTDENIKINNAELIANSAAENSVLVKQVVAETEQLQSSQQPVLTAETEQLQSSQQPVLTAEESTDKTSESLANNQQDLAIEITDLNPQDLTQQPETQLAEDLETQATTAQSAETEVEEVEFDESLIVAQSFSLDLQNQQFDQTSVNSNAAKSNLVQMAFEDFSSKTKSARPVVAVSQALVVNEDQQKPMFANLAGSEEMLNVFTKAAVEKFAGQFAPIQNVAANSAQALQNLIARETQALQQQAALTQESLAEDEQSEDAGTEQGAGFFNTATSSETRPGSSPSLASINYPLRHPQWANAVGKRLVFMVNNQLQQAQITLNPEKLGPVQIRLSLDRDQVVSVSMTAQHGATRETLEQAIPRLREMLAEAGIDFDSLEVKDEKSFEQDAKQQNSQQQAGLEDSMSEEETTKVRKYETDNTIDFYA